MRPLERRTEEFERLSSDRLCVCVCVHECESHTDTEEGGDGEIEAATGRGHPGGWARRGVEKSDVA